MNSVIYLTESVIRFLQDKSIKRMEKNHRFLEILKRIGLIKLENDFDSIYIHALVDYGNNSEPVELIGLFSAKPVKTAFQEEFYQNKTGILLPALKEELRNNKKLSCLQPLYSSDDTLKTEIEKFRERFKYFVLQSGSSFEREKYNELNRLMLTVLEERQKKSFDYQVERYMMKLRDEFQRDFLDNNYYIDLDGETRIKIKEKTAAGRFPEREEDEEPGKPPGEKDKEELPYDVILYEPLDVFIDKWLKDDAGKLLVIVGEYGTGKTTFCRHLAHALAAGRLETAGAEKRIPLYFPLRDFEKNIQSFIVNQFSKEGVDDIDYARFQQRLADDEFVIMLDGFDEMTQRIDAAEKDSNFDKISRMIDSGSGSKVILTTREEYFRTEEDFERVFRLKERGDYRFVFLRPFNDAQIRRYLDSHTDDPEFYWQQIEETFDLHDLAKRPVLLQLIVDHLPGLISQKLFEIQETRGAGDLSTPREPTGRPQRVAPTSEEIRQTHIDIKIKSVDLYERCIREELRRKSEDLAFDFPDRERMVVLEKAAVWLFQRGELAFDVAELDREINLRQYVPAATSWEFERRINQFLTFTFLIREADNRFRISHISFRDYLTARAFVSEINDGNIENFAERRMPDDINRLIVQMNPSIDRLLHLIKTARDLPENKKWQGTNAANILLRIAPTILRSQDISHCNLQYVDLRNCDLTGTNLQMADLSYARVDENILKADFANAVFHETSFDFPADIRSEIEKVVKTGVKNIPLDIQFFDKIVNGGFIYVDKTGLIADLIESGWTYFFLSRPRRFGKSLLVSTMKEIFSGNKKLFKNLKIYDRIDWKRYPVIHFDFSLVGIDDENPVRKVLADEVDKITLSHDLPIVQGNHKTKFRYLIENLSKKESKPVVVLIDEYDKFIIDYINDDRRRDINRSELKDFFSILKGSGPFLRFLFITGVSRFTRVSIFSDLNNLIDLTFKPEYAAIAGYTEGELLKYFYYFIMKFAAKEGYRFAEALNHIREWYDGYSWDGHTRVYNPYSILKLFVDLSFGNHWYSTCTPTFLIQSIRERKMQIQELDNIQVSRSKLENAEVTNLELIPLLFQTGYLTITGKRKKSIGLDEYNLDYPNKDVRYSFLNHLLEDYSPKNTRAIDHITNALEENRPEDALENMKSIFAGVPYENFDPNNEHSYHALVHVIFTLILDNIGSQIQTIRGRIDTVVETGKYIYIFEFKMENAHEAMKQIHEKKYYEKYIIKKKEIILVGVSFSKDEKNIKEWIIEKL